MTSSRLLCFRRVVFTAVFLGAAVACAQVPVLPVVQDAVEPIYAASHSGDSNLMSAASTSVPTSAETDLGSASASLPSADVLPPSSSVLPDTPSSLKVEPSESSSLFADAFQTPATATPTVAPKLTKYIPYGWSAQSITAHDKVHIGLRDLYSPLNFIAMIASAGYEHALNGEPNYGTDRGAFGQRLGAAAIRESTQGFFTDSVFSPIFHEDPRYYVQGEGHGFFYRTMYAVTRPLITRTDSGRNSVNGALLAGYAASTALTYTYYPPINRNFHDTASIFGGSLGGAALGFFVSEFSDDALKAIHLRKR